LKENIPHIPVLFDEVLDAFSLCNNGYIIDCTLGYGGHSEGLLKKYPNIRLICNDQDDTALEFSKKRLDKYKDRIVFNKGNFKDIVEKFKDYNIVGILADIGVSSLQLDQEDRGFGFESNILDMRMDQNQELSAKDVVNNYDLQQLEYIFKEYGEVREYKKAASLLVENRPFNSAKDLSTMFNKNFYKSKLHPATLPFQAIRIEVNNELGVLDDLFKSIQIANLTNCTVAIISFHSLEDRIVKNNFKQWSQKCICPVGVFKCECGNNNQKGKIITKKPIIPTKEEIKLNKRSRSSKLRIFKFEKFRY
jgi:16S rRNA (cytosine1402-N4)-methyltransferase